MCIRNMSVVTGLAGFPSCTTPAVANNFVLDLTSPTSAGALADNPDLDYDDAVEVRLLLEKLAGRA